MNSTSSAQKTDPQPAYEELLHFFNESTDLLCIAGFDGRFKRLNPAWHLKLGWTRAELQARPFLDFVHPDDRPATLAVMRQLDVGTPTITFENRYRCKNGSHIWLQWTASPLPGFEQIYAIARDVTLRKQLEKEVLDTLDLERERVGRELHDGLCQDLAGISALSASLAGRLAQVSAPESAAAREIGELLGEAIRQARDLARGNNPQLIGKIGLVAALADFCSNTETMFGITCSFDCECGFPELGARRDLNLYRIVQQAIGNAITHGRARRIGVTLNHQNGKGVLAVEDDGCGIDGSIGESDGIGLHTMGYRARLIGGVLTLECRIPHGTAVSCVFLLS